MLNSTLIIFIKIFELSIKVMLSTLNFRQYRSDFCSFIWFYQSKILVCSLFKELILINLTNEGIKVPKSMFQYKQNYQANYFQSFIFFLLSFNTIQSMFYIVFYPYKMNVFDIGINKNSIPTHEIIIIFIELILLFTLPSIYRPIDTIIQLSDIMRKINFRIFLFIRFL